MTAALQAPVIMMLQNCEAIRDRIDASQDYEVNLKAELEISKIAERLEEFSEQKWNDPL